MQVVQVYVVYRVVASGEKVPVGELVERRRGNRRDNAADMLRLARMRYSSSAFEALEIIVEPTGWNAFVKSDGSVQR